MQHDRIPDLPNNSRFAMERWFQKLYMAGLLYNVDDPAETIVRIDTGERTFTPDECVRLDEAVERMFDHHGDAVYEVALKYTRKALGWPIDTTET